MSRNFSLHWTPTDFHFWIFSHLKARNPTDQMRIIVLWDVISISFTELSFKYVKVVYLGIFWFIYFHSMILPRQCLLQGDVPRQLGWSAADHWGLAPWMASHGGSRTHIGWDDAHMESWSGWVGQVYGWYLLAEDKHCTSMFAWKQEVRLMYWWRFKLWDHLHTCLLPAERSSSTEDQLQKTLVVQHPKLRFLVVMMVGKLSLNMARTTFNYPDTWLRFG